MALEATATGGLPDGAARAEAVAVRLRRLGVPLRSGEPVLLRGRTLLAWCRERGRSSVAIARADPSLIPELQVGAFHRAGVAARAARRVLRRLPTGALATALALGGTGRLRRVLADAAFWGGVRADCRDDEWLRLTRAYTVLLYHRLAGEMKPGQERLDLPPEQFDAHMRLLGRLRCRRLSLAGAIAFHADPAAILPRRACLVTADDAFADCAAALTRHGGRRPALFVPTGAVGGVAGWADGERVAGWPALCRLRDAGGELGAHSRSHADLPQLADAALEREVVGALEDLAAAVPAAPCTFAYPHGRHDLRVRDAVRRAGARLAFTTDVGANGAGTDPWCLRRIGVKAHDSLPAFAWKALTGEPLPGRWERRRLRRARAGGPRSSPQGRGAAPDPQPAAPPSRPRA